MKKHLHNSLRALFLSLAVLLSLPMLAVEVEIDEINYYLNAETREASVTSKSSGEYSGKIVIPESVNYNGTTYSVTSIWYATFTYCSGLTSVTIGSGVTGIGDGVFKGCSGLTEVKVDANNPKYDSRGNCNALIETSSNTLISGCQTTVIPNSVTGIGDGAFSGCSGLKSVTIPNSVTSIGREAFCDCSGLTSVTMPNSVTSIGEEAFCDCSGLTSVTIPNSVESIGDGAFRRCSGLTSVTIGSGVKSIEWSAFANCPELLDVYCYAENVPSTESNAFDGSYSEYTTLHVPAASIDSYRATAPWSSFGKIVALTSEETGIDEQKGENGKVKTALYDLSGRRVQKGQKGVFIQNSKIMIQ